MSRGPAGFQERAGEGGSALRGFPECQRIELGPLSLASITFNISPKPVWVGWGGRIVAEQCFRSKLHIM